MKRLPILWLLVISAFAVPTTSQEALAHHMGADKVADGKPILWHGVVNYVSWDGPHVMYAVDVRNASGVLETWQVLGSSPKHLASRGVLKQTIKRGDNVNVAGYLNIYSHIVSPVYISLDNGPKLFIGYFADANKFPVPAQP